MRVLLVGSGGREHALGWTLAASPRVKELISLPGNPGLAGLGPIVEGIDPSNPGAVAAMAAAQRVDLVVVGPEAPLAAGVVDALTRQGTPVFGPTRAAARLEASKSHAKEVMSRAGVPTGWSVTVTDAEEARRQLESTDGPYVVKADGLAAGKGVIVARTVEEALQGVDAIMVQNSFGEAGRTLVVEEFLEGEEASFLAFSDGKTVLPMASSQDHKPVFDGDRGPNTGGMGAYSPAPVLTPELFAAAVDTVIRPMVEGMAAEGTPYVGVLYAGLMIRDGQLKVLEFNCRFGDPECQPIVMRMRGDLLPVLEACIDGRLEHVRLEWDPRAAVCVVEG